jgi:hypothetical protein
MSWGRTHDATRVQSASQKHMKKFVVVERGQYDLGLTNTTVCVSCEIAPDYVFSGVCLCQLGWCWSGQVPRTPYPVGVKMDEGGLVLRTLGGNE